MDGPTTRIGRYEILGQVALGGMAEILLGRLLGPSGFERVVVIKRVLPHLSQHAAFTSMFLDEARIAAAIRHPNVVQVHELGMEDDVLFLVMEYLEGESLHGLMRRLTIVGEHLDPALVGYIGAQACSGLHAAHELPDAEGRPSGLVHRDISPQNIFITYDGAVKVLDFGIAKAADRITQTEAGTLKGKFAYMSPEQCTGQALDRRSDVFSLGIVLYESVTGRRMFSRASQLQTLNAVVSDAFPPPSELAPLPPALEAVILRALERNRDARFASAAEMRRALGEAAVTYESPAVPEEALAQLMRRLFADRIEEKREMLRRVRAGSLLSAVPSADIDIDVELPTIEGAHIPLQGPRSGEVASEPEPRAPRRRTALLALLAAIVVGGAMAVGLSASSGTKSPEGTPVSAAAPDSAPSAEVSASTPATLTTVAPSEPADRRIAPENDPMIILDVRSEPDGARVFIDGRQRGVTPVALEIPHGPDPLNVRIARGRLEAVQSILPDRDQRLNVVLATPIRRRARPPAERRPDDGFERFD